MFFFFLKRLIFLLGGPVLFDVFFFFLKRLIFLLGGPVLFDIFFSEKVDLFCWDLGVLECWFLFGCRSFGALVFFRPFVVGLYLT